jgi:hypothetical protein
LSIRGLRWKSWRIELFLRHQGIDRLEDFIGTLETTCVFPFADEFVHGLISGGNRATAGISVHSAGLAGALTLAVALDSSTAATVIHHRAQRPGSKDEITILIRNKIAH